MRSEQERREDPFEAEQDKRLFTVGPKALDFFVLMGFVIMASSILVHP